MPCAIITGVGGQDGSYLSEFLLEKGYHVFGMVRRHSTMITLDRLKEARKHPNFQIMYGDVTDITSIFQLIKCAMNDPAYEEGPLEVYNLAAQSHVKVSFETPMYTSNADALGVLNLLSAIVTLDLTKKVRFYQASTSELYGSSAPPQREDTPFHPRSPYAIAKLYAYWMVRNYREAYGMYAVNGILFNHESERRGETFVSRKITRAVAQYILQNDAILTLGNIHALRDWGHAADYVQAMWKMLQHDVPEDFVIATGECHTVKEFVEAAFKVIGTKIRWEGSGEDEKGYDNDTGALLVRIDPKYYRLTEVNHLQGDPSKAREKLGWVPQTRFQDLVYRMVQHDIQTIVL
jgi:GDPmannose 4,6-dehydratase